MQYPYLTIEWISGVYGKRGVYFGPSIGRANQILSDSDAKLCVNVENAFDERGALTLKAKEALIKEARSYALKKGFRIWVTFSELESHCISELGELKKVFRAPDAGIIPLVVTLSDLRENRTQFQDSTLEQLAFQFNGV